MSRVLLFGQPLPVNINNTRLHRLLLWLRTKQLPLFLPRYCTCLLWKWKAQFITLPLAASYPKRHHLCLYPWIKLKLHSPVLLPFSLAESHGILKAGEPFPVIREDFHSTPNHSSQAKLGKTLLLECMLSKLGSFQKQCQLHTVGQGMPECTWNAFPLFYVLLFYKNNQLKPNPLKIQVCAFHLNNWEAKRKLQVSWEARFWIIALPQSFWVSFWIEPWATKILSKHQTESWLQKQHS